MSSFIMIICYIIILLNITACTAGFLLTTSPNQATVGESLSFVCTTNEQFVAFNKNGMVYCIIMNNKGNCSLDSSTCPTITSSCSIGKHTTITLPGSLVNANLHGSKWMCASPFGIGNPSSEIELYVNVPLQGVSLTPNGTLTIRDGQTQECKCFARSLPIAYLSWQLDRSVLPTSSPPVTTTDTVTITYTYTAKRGDNGKTLSCTAVYGSTTFTEDALINVLYRPSVIISPNYSEYTVIENTTNFELNCTVIAAAPVVTSYKWYKDGAVIVGSTDVLHTISTVRRSHTGSYRCDASNDVGTSNFSSALQLKVMFGADIMNIDKKEPKAGEQLLIMCSVQSNPPVTDNDVTWTKENNNTFSMTQKQLVIRDVNRLDSGTFVCSVVIKLTPTVGQSIDVTGRTTVEVDVLYRPSVTIFPNNSEYKVIENTTNFEFYCTVTAAKPAVTSYKWYKDGFVIVGSIDGLHTISKVRRFHTGSYRCDATNDIGTSDRSSAVKLQILFGADIMNIDKKELKEGEQLLVMCSVQSNPSVTDDDVTWTKQNNITFNMKRKHLELRNVNRLDSGTFVCTVAIKLTPTIGQPIDVTGRTTAEVDVLYRPSVTISPNYSDYKVIENTTNFEFSCTMIAASPAVTSYQWYKDGVVIVGSTDVLHTISTVRRSHTGSYRCDATNDIGTSDRSSAVQLQILYGVELYSISKQIQSEGNQLTITSTGQSYPLMTSSDFKWTKYNNNTFSRKGQQLSIVNVNRVDTGTYVCSVLLQLVPSVGRSVNVTGSITVEVEILYRPDVTVSPVRNPYKVIENTTNLHLKCNVTDANPAVTSYRWYKDGFPVSTAATYTISTLYRSHTGSYTCDASNTVGISDPSSLLQLNVLYGVSLILSRPEINIDESDRLVFSCIGDGNPLPNIVCVYRNNGTTVGEQKSNAISLSVDHANCVDTGYYVCSGNNTIGEPVSQSAEIKVACKPRTYNNVDTEDIFMRTTDEAINISTTFISFPLSHISWSRELSDGQLADLDSSFNSSIISSHLPYETKAILQKDQLKSNEFGIYLVNASNMYGSFLMKYHFIQKRDPILPSYVYVVCKTATAIVILKPIVNENLPQDLYIQYAVEGKDMMSIKVHTNNANQPNRYTVYGLNPGRKYNFSILAVNQYGETRSNQFECLTETLSYSEDMLAVKQGDGGLFSAGIASLVVGLLFFVAAAIFIFRKRFRKTYTKSSKSDDYADLQASNPAFQDPYTSIHNPIESRHHQESSVNTYEECGNASDAAAYQNIENMKSGHKKEENNLGIYDNMKI